MWNGNCYLPITLKHITCQNDTIGVILRIIYRPTQKYRILRGHEYNSNTDISWTLYMGCLAGNKIKRLQINQILTSYIFKLSLSRYSIKVCIRLEGCMNYYWRRFCNLKDSNYQTGRYIFGEFFVICIHNIFVVLECSPTSPSYLFMQTQMRGFTIYICIYVVLL